MDVHKLIASRQHFSPVKAKPRLTDVQRQVIETERNAATKAYQAFTVDWTNVTKEDLLESQTRYARFDRAARALDLH